MFSPGPSRRSSTSRTILLNFGIESTNPSPCMRECTRLPSTKTSNGSRDLAYVWPIFGFVPVVIIILSLSSSNSSCSAQTKDLAFWGGYFQLLKTTLNSCYKSGYSRTLGKKDHSSQTLILIFTRSASYSCLAEARSLDFCSDLEMHLFERQFETDLKV